MEGIPPKELLDANPSANPSANPLSASRWLPGHYWETSIRSQRVGTRELTS